MRILITGGSSYLGQHLVPSATKRHTVLYTFFSHDPLPDIVSPQPLAAEGQPLDMRDGAAVESCVKAFNPDVIIHLAGSNRSPDMTAVITQGATAITTAAAAVGARLIHLSSDVVFDGRHAPYKEEAPRQPLHAYGQAKSRAEDIVAAYADHVIVRTSLIYGLGQIDRGTAWIVDALQQQEPVTLFTDQIRNPICADTLSAACLELADHAYRGLLHIAGAQTLSRAEFGLKLLDWWQVDARETLTCAPTPADAPWPLDTRLDIARAQSELDTALDGVDVVLARATTGSSRPVIGGGFHDRTHS